MKVRFRETPKSEARAFAPYFIPGYNNTIALLKDSRETEQEHSKNLECKKGTSQEYLYSYRLSKCITDRSPDLCLHQSSEFHYTRFIFSLNARAVPLAQHPSDLKVRWTSKRPKTSSGPLPS